MKEIGYDNLLGEERCVRNQITAEKETGIEKMGTRHIRSSTMDR